MKDYKILYENALERAKKVHNGELTISPDEVNDFNVYEYIFPELRESEDERIRKEIIAYLDVQEVLAQGKDGDFKEWIAWLEKQGEQKHVIVPKFRVGDTIRFKGNETLKGEDKTHRIIDYDNELYVFDDGTTDLFSEQNLYELVEQKQEWGEEDEKMLNDVIDTIHDAISNCDVDDIGTEARFCYKNEISWLKSLKDIVQPQPKQVNTVKDD